jgi:hypothetical protein
MRKMIVVSCLMLTAFLHNAIPAAAASSNDLLHRVEEAYKNYAWVAVFGVTVDSTMRPLADEKIFVLRQYFTEDLANAIVRERQLDESSGGVGNIDFEILFDSQDPSASDLTIEPIGAYEVVACFKQMSQKKCVTFVGSAESGAIKIRDIKYENGYSIRQLLKLP